MSLKRVQVFFLLGICAISLHFTILFGTNYARFLSLNEKARPRITQWEILPKKGLFALKANYEFQAQEKIWQNSSLLKPPYYLNEIAALDALKKEAKKDRFVWYHSGSPSLCDLEKIFPTQYLIRMLICYGVLIYFLYLYKKVVKV